MPAVGDEDERAKDLAEAAVATAMDEDENEDEEEDGVMVKGGELTPENSSDNGFFDGLLDGFSSIESFCLRDVLGSPIGFDGL